MRRITMNVTDEQYEALKKRERETGCTQSEQIRRAIDAALKEERESAEMELRMRATNPHFVQKQKLLATREGE